MHVADGTFSSTTTTGPSNPTLKRSLGQAFGFAHEESQKRHVQELQNDNNYVKTFRAALSYYGQRCAFCTVCDAPTAGAHSPKECPRLKPHYSDYCHIKVNISYGPYHGSICWRCHVPQCRDRLHPTYVKGSTDACEYADVILPAVFAGLTLPTLAQAAAVAFKQEWATPEQVVEWMNSKPIPGHESNLTAFFLWMDHYRQNCM
jgi:hypothetical protein